MTFFVAGTPRFLFRTTPPVRPLFSFRADYTFRAIFNLFSVSRTTLINILSTSKIINGLIFC